MPVVSAEEAAKNAATLVVAVKPQDMGAMLDQIAGLVTESQLVISLAAGITTSFIELRFPVEVPVVRVTTNTPLLVNEGMSVISAGSFASQAHLGIAEEMLSPVGKVLRLPEYQQDAATALAGSGPAYVYYLIEAMADAGRAGRHAPPDRPRARHPDGLRGGDDGAGLGRAPGDPARGGDVARRTTIAAIRELERHGVRAAVFAAIEAARNRGRELGGS